MSDELKKHLRKHVDEHQYDIDPQEIWDGILQKEAKRKRRPLYWLLPLLGLVAMVWFTVTTINHDQVLNTEQLLGNLQSPQNEAIVTTEDKAEPVMATIENTETFTDLTAVANTDAEVTSSAFVSPIKKESFNTSQSNFSTTSITSSSATTSSTTTTSNQFFNDTRLGESPSSKENAITPVDEEEIQQPPLARQLSPLASVSSYLAYDTDRFSYDLMSHIIPLRKGKRMTLRLLGGVGTVSNQISPVVPDPGQANAYQSELRRSANSAQFAYNGRVMMDIEISKGFFLGAGISYEKVIERFLLDGNYIVDAQGNLVTETILDTEGSTAVNFNSESNTEEYYVSIDRSIDSYNGYEYVDIPLQLGYAYSFGRWTPSVFVGTSLNVMSKNTGYLYGSDGIPTTYADTDKPFQIGLRYHGGIGVDFQLCRQMVMTLGLDFSHRRRENHGVVSQYQVLGSHLGLGYQF